MCLHDKVDQIVNDKHFPYMISGRVQSSHPLHPFNIPIESEDQKHAIKDNDRDPECKMVVRRIAWRAYVKSGRGLVGYWNQEVVTR